MDDQATLIRDLTVELPADAPMIRVTAGLGSAGQKTWNLRRPVTVIGSRRPAHIVLHDEDISNAHCVIVNTGTEVLLKDLHTSSGTQLNKTRVNLAVLADGDVINLGNTTIQVAIQIPESGSDDSSFGLEFADPTKFLGPVSLRLIHTDTNWQIEDAVVLIGRHDDAGVRLDHADVSARHALLFRVGTTPAVFDLGSRTGLWVNGQRCSLTPLHNDDRITVGTFGLLMQCFEPGANTRLDMPATPSMSAPDGTKRNTEEVGTAHATSAPATATILDTPLCIENNSASAALETELKDLHGDITETWERLNHWRTQLRNGTSALDEKETGPESRDVEADAKDAAFRGQLHDVSRLHEQILVRERELAAQAAQLQAERDAIADYRKGCSQLEADLARREQELNRREHALAQRWSRLLTTTCPHCRQPVSIGNVDPE